MSKTPDPSLGVPRVVLSLWLIDGEDMIAAANESEMRKTYRDYHGESIRGHDRVLIPPDELVDLTDGGDEFWQEKASEIATTPMYIPCYR